MRLRTRDQFEKDRFTSAQLDKLREILLKNHEFFYHCTNPKNLDSIQNKGLLADMANPEMLAYGAPSCLCYCTKNKLENTYGMKLDSINNFNTNEPPITEAIIFKVSATDLLSKSFGLDWSASQTFNFTVEQYGTDRECELQPEHAAEAIASSGYIVCYDDIESSMLTIQPLSKSLWI